MKRYIESIFLIAVLIASTPAHAALKSFKLKKAIVKMDVPKKWQAAQGFMGMPLIVLAPEEKNEKRAVIGVVPIGKVKFKMDEKQINKDTSDYEKNKKAWLKKHNGKALDFFPVETQTWKHAKGFSVGVRYELDDQEYEERLYYMLCDQVLFHIKTITTPSQKKKLKNLFDKTLKSFDCKRQEN